MLVALVAVVAVVFGAPQRDHEATPIPILHDSRIGPNPNGSYSYDYGTGNGIRAHEHGRLETSDRTKNASMVVKGGYSYTAPDGTLISVTYDADKNGFRPVFSLTKPGYEGNRGNGGRPTVPVHVPTIYEANGVLVDKFGVPIDPALLEKIEAQNP